MFRTALAPVTLIARRPYRLARRMLGRLAEAIAVTPGQRRLFDRDGFLVLDPGIPDKVLEQVKADVAGHYQPAPAGTVGCPLVGRVQDAWTFSPAVRSVALWPRILRVLKALYGRQPKPFQTLNFPVGTEQPVHSDTMHFNSVPGGWMCGVWVALEDLGPDCGPVVYYPGSHTLPEYSLEEVGAPDGENPSVRYHHYEQFVKRLIRDHDLQPQYATLRKGQAFVWAGNLLHGGSPRRDPNCSRHSQVTHVFFEGCRYYTPVFSTRQNVEWREPRWIS
ncbi:MAG TPA: phytanoyl-CoA dioxygenase family protein [Gemmataceae bacterium]|jgi:hypothetical protein|nr:phytanoyl-CoA dioxygenase family protein [Gemmataceae bacterium]